MEKVISPFKLGLIPHIQCNINICLAVRILDEWISIAVITVICTLLLSSVKYSLSVGFLANAAAVIKSAVHAKMSFMTTSKLNKTYILNIFVDNMAFQ